MGKLKHRHGAKPTGRHRTTLIILVEQVFRFAAIGKLEGVLVRETKVTDVIELIFKK